MKIKEIKVSNYKVLQNFKISFVDNNKNILNTIVIAGINGSGKTTILELIKNSFDFNFRFNSYDDYIVVDKRKELFNNKSIDSNNLINNELFGSTFIDDITNNLKYKYIPFLNSKIIYFKVFENQKELVISKIKDFLDFIRENNEDLTIKESNKKIVNEINSIFDGINLKTKFKGISKDIKREILFENSLKQDIKLDDLSTGEQQLFIRALSLKMMNLKDSIILIDEPEISLHPNWQNKILTIYQNIAKIGDNQLIIATHSPQIISSTPNQSLRVLIENNKTINVISYDKSYGIEIGKVLEQLMDTQYLRTPIIGESINKMWSFLESEDLDEFEKIYSKLENILDLNDKDLVLARLEKAMILSQNDKY